MSSDLGLITTQEQAKIYDYDDVLQKEDMTVLDSCAVHYHIKVVWRLLGLVPPPPAFLLQMTEVATLGTQAAALQALR